MNILDYIDWRGDLTFAAAPLNEVDNLIFAKLSYLDLRGLVPEDFAGAVSLRNLREAYRREGRVPLSPNSSDPGPLLDKAAASARFGGVLLRGFRSRTDREDQSQFAAVTFCPEAGPACVTFRGTDNSLVGWREDFNFSFLPHTPGQAEAARYLSYAGAALSGPLVVCGHSKGGNFAVYAAAFCAPQLRERIVKVYSDDGPGFHRSIAESAEYAAVLPKVQKLLPETSLVGILLTDRESRKVVRSEAKGIKQHDPYTWQVLGPAFVPADASFASVFMDETLERWIGGLEDEQRAMVVSAIFDTLEASGVDTMAELNANRWLSYNAIWKAVRGLDPKVVSGVGGALKELAAASTDVLWNETRRAFERLDPTRLLRGNTTKTEEKT